MDGIQNDDEKEKKNNSEVIQQKELITRVPGDSSTSESEKKVEIQWK